MELLQRDSILAKSLVPLVWHERLLTGNSLVHRQDVVEDTSFRYQTHEFDISDRLNHKE